MRKYDIGTKESLLRIEVTNNETGETTDMFFDTYEQVEIVLEAMCQAYPQKYSYCNYGGYYLEVIGC